MDDVPPDAAGRQTQFLWSCDLIVLVSSLFIMIFYLIHPRN
jgi:hypothetical protein